MEFGLKKICIIATILFLISFLAWKLFAEPNLTHRIPSDWSFKAEYLGNLVWGGEEEKFISKKNLTLYQRSWKVREWQFDRAVIDEIYQTFDVQTGEMTWEAKLQYNIDPRNGKVISYDTSPEAKGLYYVFPQNVQRQDYVFFNSDLYPYTMHYQRTENRDGLDLYVFSFFGKLDFTKVYNLGYVTPTAGLTGKYNLIVEDFYRELWVEPVSGEIVHIIEDDPGDYLVDAATGEKKRLYAVWSGKTTGNTVNYLLKNAKQRRWQIRLYREWIPKTLLIATLFFMAMTLLVHIRLKRGAV